MPGASESAENIENALGLGNWGSKSRVSAYDPAALPFDPRTHTAVELLRSDQLFGLVLSHLGLEGTIVDEDAVSFGMCSAGKSGSRKPAGSCGTACGGGGCGHAGDTGSTEENIAVSLGLGLFRFMHNGTEIKALFQNVGDPVGTACGADVFKSLVLFTEGVGQAQIIRNFLAYVLAKSEVMIKNTFQVYRWHVKRQHWQRVTRVVARPVSSVVLPEAVSAKVVDDMSEFLSQETGQFYQEHGIPYKRSYLFHGVPGAGKTSMIQALAGKFGRNLCYMSPTHPELTDDALKSAIERVPERAIVVVEDVDALFSKNREKKVRQSPLTFSGLLNALDGVGNHEGLIFVLTTNFKEQLDSALIRDGRVDMRVHFDYCTAYQMQKMFENFYPQTAAQLGAGNEFDSDPAIAELEAKIAALRRAKAGDASADAGPRKASGAAFRDALLLSLGERKVTAAQLQHFFITHRKCTAEEAIADVGAIAAAVDERLKEEAEKEGAEKGGAENRGAAKGGAKKEVQKTFVEA